MTSSSHLPYRENLVITYSLRYRPGRTTVNQFGIQIGRLPTVPSHNNKSTSLEKYELWLHSVLLEEVRCRSSTDSPAVAVLKWKREENGEESCATGALNKWIYRVPKKPVTIVFLALLRTTVRLPIQNEISTPSNIYKHQSDRYGSE